MRKLPGKNWRGTKDADTAQTTPMKVIKVDVRRIINWWAVITKDRRYLQRTANIWYKYALKGVNLTHCSSQPFISHGCVAGS